MRKRNGNGKSKGPGQPQPPPKPRPPDLERLHRHLLFLGLTHTRTHLEDLLAWATRESPSYTTLLEHVLGAEVDSKLTSRIERRVRTSGLIERKLLEPFDWDFQPKLDRALVLELATLDFVRRCEDLVITGKSGTGKSHILRAFGLRACEQSISVRFTRCVDLLDDLHAALSDGTYQRRLCAWARPQLLIIDDVGLGQLRKRDDEPTAAHTLFNLVDRRHGRSATAISSNIDLRHWGRYLGDTTITMAILDRLVMNAIRIDIDGPSYRKRVAEQRAQQRKGKASRKPESQPPPEPA